MPRAAAFRRQNRPEARPIVGAAKPAGGSGLSLSLESLEKEEDEEGSAS